MIKYKLVDGTSISVDVSVVACSKCGGVAVATSVSGEVYCYCCGKRIGMGDLVRQE